MHILLHLTGSMCQLRSLIAVLFLGPSAFAATVQVEVGDDFFRPANARINVDDTVRWTWIGVRQHSTTSTTGLWNSGTHGNGFTFSRKFSATGTFPYFCTVHDDQTGSVQVSGTAPPPVDPAALGDGVDAPALSWTTGGAASWINQNKTTHDRVDAAQSGRISHRADTWIETTVTGPGTVRFWWKVSSEPNDRLRFLVDGTQKARISGEINWQQRSISVGAGTHVLRWIYAKNRTLTGGRDRAWLDQVRFTQSP